MKDLNLIFKLYRVGWVVCILSDTNKRPNYSFIINYEHGYTAEYDENLKSRETKRKKVRIKRTVTT
jgi:hypothetical protein